jgi:hypothetical protein
MDDPKREAKLDELPRIASTEIAALAALPRETLHELAPLLIEATRSISQHFGGVLRPNSTAARPAAAPSSSARLLADTQNVIGESPVYDATNERLYWVDMYDPAIFRFDCRSGVLSSYPQEEMVTALGLTPGSELRSC